MLPTGDQYLLKWFVANFIYTYAKTFQQHTKIEIINNEIVKKVEGITATQQHSLNTIDPKVVLGTVRLALKYKIMTVSI